MKNDQLLPDWARPFSCAGEANRYWDLVCEVAELRWGAGVTFDYLNGSLTLDNGGVVYIANIARDAVRYDLQTQRRSLYGFLSAMDDFDPAALDQQMRDWEWVRPRLRLRISAPYELDTLMVERPLGASINMTIGVEVASGCIPLPKERLANLPLSEDETWILAEAATLAQAGVSRHVVPAGGPIVYEFRGGLFTSGLALDLSKRMGARIGELGALVACPTAHFMLVHPITRLDTLAEAASKLLVLAWETLEIEPNPIGLNILWYRGPGILQPCLSMVGDGRLLLEAEEPVRSELEELVQAADRAFSTLNRRRA